MSARAPSGLLLLAASPALREAAQGLAAGSAAELPLGSAHTVEEARAALAAGRFDGALAALSALGAEQEARHAAVAVLSAVGALVLVTDLEAGPALSARSSRVVLLAPEELSPARLRGALHEALSLRQVALERDAREQQQRRHARQLRSLAQYGRRMAAAQGFEELTQLAVTAARRTLEAPYALLCTEHTQGVAAARSEGDPLAVLSRWAEQAAAHAGEGAVSSAEGLRWFVRTSALEGAASGYLAVELGEPAEDAGAVLEQLASLVAVCAEGLAQRQAAQRAGSVRDEVLAVVSHDLRTPLNTLRLGAGLLREQVGAEARVVLDRMDRGVLHMARLVDDLVDMVRVEGSQLELSPTPEGVEGLLRSAHELVAPQAESAGLRVLLVSPREDASVLVDRHRMLQVLLNLLGNAVKFTSSGGELELGAELRGAEVVLRVRDTGRGIPDAEQARVFLRFWKSDSAQRRGLGLGLYIARGIVEAHRGRVWFDTEVGRGTTFFVALPRYLPPSPGAATLKSGEGPRPRVALVEDDDDARWLVGSALTREGFEVLAFADAESLLASEVLAPSPLALLVSDVGLPGLDGVALVERLRARSPALTAVLVSAQRSEALSRRALAAGALELLPKPLELPRLVGLLRAHLALHEP